MIYSVATVTWNDLHELLVVSRKDDPKQYCLPGGKVEYSDYPEGRHQDHYYKFFELPEPDMPVLKNTASRELKEETGLYLPPDEFYHLYTATHSFRGNPYTCSTFWAPFKTLPEPRAIEPGTWVGWRKPEQLLKNSPFADYMTGLFDFIGVRIDALP